MSYSILVFGGIGLAILVYFNLMDKNTHRWRKIENRNDICAYIALFGTIIAGIIASFLKITSSDSVYKSIQSCNRLAYSDRVYTNRSTFWNVVTSIRPTSEILNSGMTTSARSECCM